MVTITIEKDFPQKNRESLFIHSSIKVAFLMNLLVLLVLEFQGQVLEPFLLALFLHE